MSKIILLTGGTGSFGRGFIKTLLADPEVCMIRVYSRDEHRQRELRETIKSDRISFFLGDVRDRDRLRRVMEGCHWIVHAAALKQAPLGEIEPQEFIKTNILGSINVVENAIDCKIEKALLISTDKAVEPINLYGATKMCAEKIFLQADAMRGLHATRFACTRYGNVACTAGSVIPFFLSLVPGRPTPVCHPEATRFWITLEKANAFVLGALKTMEGGEIFIPPQKSVRIMDIARALRPAEKIEIIGLRPGDKLHEVLELTPKRISSDSNDFLNIQEIQEYVFDNGPSIEKVA